MGSIWPTRAETTTSGRQICMSTKLTPASSVRIYHASQDDPIDTMVANTGLDMITCSRGDALSQVFLCEHRPAGGWRTLGTRGDRRGFSGSRSHLPEWLPSIIYVQSSHHPSQPVERSPGHPMLEIDESPTYFRREWHLLASDFAQKARAAGDSDVSDFLLGWMLARQTQS